MNRGNTWAIYRDPRDLETPIRIDVGTFASAWLAHSLFFLLSLKSVPKGSWN